MYSKLSVDEGLLLYYTDKQVLKEDVKEIIKIFKVLLAYKI